MKFPSIGFLPMLMALMLGVLFTLKFHKESRQTEYAIKLQFLIDEAKYDGNVAWKARRSNYFQALKVLSDARAKDVDLEDLLDQAVEEMGTDRAYSGVLAAGLLRNLDLADEMDLLTDENFKLLEAGEKLKIGAGGFEGEDVVLGNLLPYRYSPELEMNYANLLLKPERVARRYPDQIGKGAITVVTACRNAELISETSFERAMRAVQK